MKEEHVSESGELLLSVCCAAAKYESEKPQNVGQVPQTAEEAIIRV